MVSWIVCFAGVVPGKPVAAPLLERAGHYCLARGASQREEEMYIVQGEQAEAEYLVGSVEVAYVGAGESRTRRAATRFVQWPRISLELGTLDVDPPIHRPCGSIAAHPGWCHAV